MIRGVNPRLGSLVWNERGAADSLGRAEQRLHAAGYCGSGLPTRTSGRTFEWALGRVTWCAEWRWVC
jgi:hypothetical protein